MLIENFKHDFPDGTITFEVVLDGEKNKVQVEETTYGASYTDINDFTEDWSDGEYDALEKFVEGCTEILHQFTH